MIQSSNRSVYAQRKLVVVPFAMTTFRKIHCEGRSQGLAVSQGRPYNTERFVLYRNAQYEKKFGSNDFHTVTAMLQGLEEQSL